MTLFWLQCDNIDYPPLKLNVLIMCLRKSIIMTFMMLRFQVKYLEMRTYIGEFILDQYTCSTCYRVFKFSKNSATVQPFMRQLIESSIRPTMEYSDVIGTIILYI